MNDYCSYMHEFPCIHKIHIFDHGDDLLFEATKDKIGDPQEKVWLGYLKIMLIGTLQHREYFL